MISDVRLQNDVVPVACAFSALPVSTAAASMAALHWWHLAALAWLTQTSRHRFAFALKDTQAREVVQPAQTVLSCRKATDPESGYTYVEATNCAQVRVTWQWYHPAVPATDASASPAQNGKRTILLVQGLHEHQHVLKRMSVHHKTLLATAADKHPVTPTLQHAKGPGAFLFAAAHDFPDMGLGHPCTWIIVSALTRNVCMYAICSAMTGAESVGRICEGAADRDRRVISKQHKAAADARQHPNTSHLIPAWQCRLSVCSCKHSEQHSATHADLHQRGVLPVAAVLLAAFGLQEHSQHVCSALQLPGLGAQLVVM